MATQREEVTILPDDEAKLQAERLAEYRVLCDRLHQYQKIRIHILGFTFTAFAAMGGLALKVADVASARSGIDFFQLTVAFAPYVVVLPAALLSVQLSRHVAHLGTYIAVFHEVGVNRGGWEYHLLVDARTRGTRDLLTSTKFGYSVAYTLLLMFGSIICFFASNAAIPTADSTVAQGYNGLLALRIAINALNCVLFLCTMLVILLLLIPALSLGTKKEFLRRWKHISSTRKIDPAGFSKWIDGLLDE